MVFTLIEVAVALAILAWVMGSALYLVQQYADERIRLREQFYASQVSWNRLLERYQDAEKWTAPTQQTSSRPNQRCRHSGRPRIGGGAVEMSQKPSAMISTATRLGLALQGAER